jgi:uncharacterized protein YhaN
MRIEQLDLISFGPFSGKSLIFSRNACENRDFHIVYGANEAGKSSALRALRALLFGIDERSPDAFLHPYPKMRIGGGLRPAGGESVYVIRRKGRANTLRDKNDRDVVEEAVLTRMLGDVDAVLFNTMYGLGHDDLVAGGREVVAGGGDLGRLIFSAGSGIIALQEIRKALGSEAEELYKPSGKKPLINAALAELGENENALRETELSGSRWTELKDEYEKASIRRESLEKELSGKEKEKNRLQRVQEALPFISRRRELLRAYAMYQGAVRLPEDFMERRRQAAAELDTAVKETRRAGHERKRIEEEMAGLLPSGAILENAELIESFYRKLESQQKAATERIELDTRRFVLLGEANDILQGLADNLRLEDAERFRLKKEQAAAIRRLSAEYEQIKARLENARASLPDIEEEIGDLTASKAALRSPIDPALLDSLQIILAEAAEYAPLEQANSRALLGLKDRKKELEARLENLGIGGLDAGSLNALAVPVLETIHAYEDRFENAGRQISELQSEHDGASEQFRHAEARLAALRMTRALPSEEDLEAAREKREQGWKLIRGLLEGGEPESSLLETFLSLTPGSENLTEAFEQHVRNADEIADRLRREADRIADHARLAAERSAAAKRAQEVEVAIENARKDLDALQDEWEGIWSPVGVPAGTPKEMERFAREVNEVKEALAVNEDNFQDARQAAVAISDCLAELKKRLEAIDPAGATEWKDEPSLARLARRGQTLLEDARSLAAKIEQVEAEISMRKKALAACKARCAAAENDLSIWRKSWKEAISPLGLSEDALPAEAAEVMEDVRALFEKLKEADALMQRIQGIDRDGEAFSRDVSSLALAVCPEVSGQPARDMALRLQQTLTRAREAKTRRDTLEKRHAYELNNEDEARKKANEMTAMLARMCEEANCNTIEDLPAAEARSKALREIETELSSVEGQIRVFAAGETVESFVESASNVDPDGIDPAVDRLDGAIRELREEKNSLAEAVGSLKNELSRMDGSAAASELAEKRQAILGRLDRAVRRYARTRISAQILDLAIERFRDKNQGPMLTRASEIFSRITCGTFDGVRPEFGDRSLPVIAGVRNGGKEAVHVSGMSEGTADQLFLSLRLAGLELALEKGGPLPFIVDDILIKFDNNRAAATLEVLSELASRTQLIFFTHHQHLVDIAENTLSAHPPFLHSL